MESPMGEIKKNRGGDVEMASSAAKGKQAAGANGHDSTAENKVDDEEDGDAERKEHDSDDPRVPESGCAVLGRVHCGEVQRATIGTQRDGA